MKYDGTRCPYCHSKNIMPLGEVELQDSSGHREVECHDCGGLWQEKVEIVGYEKIEEPLPIYRNYA